MMGEQNYVIAIGRQVGSGGASIGKIIADALSFKYLDREILTHAAKMLRVSEDNLAMIEERSFSFWQTILQATSYDARFMLSDYYLPTGIKLFEAESQIIKNAAEESPCVIVGRCGSHLFKNHPRAVRIFLHAAPEIRIKNMAERFRLSEDKARKALEQIDRERDRYYNTYTGRRRQDASEYDITVDTGILGQELTIRLLLQYIKGRFPELAQKDQ